jgi:hypothetical protein
MANALIAAETWLYSKLSTDVTLAGLVGSRIYTEIAPEAAIYPLVLIKFSDARDSRGVGAVRIKTDITYFVVVIGAGNSAVALATTEARLNTLLDRSPGGSNSYGTVMSCVRAGPYTQVDLIDGKPYRQLGGEYLLQVQ